MYGLTPPNWCAYDCQSSSLGRERSVADPDIMAKGFDVRGLVATGVPYPGLATIELDVGMRIEFVC